MPQFQACIIFKDTLEIIDKLLDEAHMHLCDLEELHDYESMKSRMTLHITNAVSSALERIRHNLHKER